MEVDAERFRALATSQRFHEAGRSIVGQLLGLGEWSYENSGVSSYLHSFGPERTHYLTTDLTEKVQKGEPIAILDLMSNIGFVRDMKQRLGTDRYLGTAVTIREKRLLEPDLPDSTIAVLRKNINDQDIWQQIRDDFIKRREQYGLDLDGYTRICMRPLGGGKALSRVLEDQLQLVRNVSSLLSTNNGVALVQLRRAIGHSSKDYDQTMTDICQWINEQHSGFTASYLSHNPLREGLQGLMKGNGYIFGLMRERNLVITRNGAGELPLPPALSTNASGKV